MSPEPTPLEKEIFQRIQDTVACSVSFAEFMDLALYHPEWGYYSDPGRRSIGRSGDFFTSVSVGDCFGWILGWEIERAWREEFESPSRFAIIEQGAHDGQLACDILSGLHERNSPLAGKVKYCLIEPSPRGREHLSGRFKEAIENGTISIISSPSEVCEPAGIFLCNELVDAFPVYRIKLEDGAWSEIQVGAEEDRLDWVVRKIEKESLLKEAVDQLGCDFPDGYTTEIQMAAHDWIQSVFPVLERGLWWVVDYGLEASDYYGSARNQGTLNCIANHQGGRNPLEAIGETDITAQVNFTALIRSAEEAGFRFDSLVDQHDFLTRASIPWFHEIEARSTSQDPVNRRRLRQFQTLTHPGIMGRVFKVAKFSRGF